jgi:hypothetical protein
MYVYSSNPDKNAVSGQNQQISSCCLAHLIHSSQSKSFGKKHSSPFICCSSLKMPSSNNIVSLVALLLLVANVYPELVLGNILDQQIPYQRQIRSLANGRWQLR